MMGVWKKHRQLRCKRRLTGKEPEARALVQEGTGLSVPRKQTLCILERSDRAKSLRATTV